LVEVGEDEVFGFFHANTAREMLEHMDKHREAGDYIPERAYDGIKADNPDLDKQIEKYVEPPEVAERRRARMKELFGDE
jgi:hypothetical protein